MGNGSSAPLDLVSATNVELLTHPSAQSDDELVKRIFRYGRETDIGDELIDYENIKKAIGGKYQGAYPKLRLYQTKPGSKCSIHKGNLYDRLITKMPEYLKTFLDANPEVLLAISTYLINHYHSWDKNIEGYLIFIGISEERVIALKEQFHRLVIDHDCNRVASEGEITYALRGISIVVMKNHIIYPSISTFFSKQAHNRVVYHQNHLWFDTTSAFFWTRLAAVIDPEARCPIEDQITNIRGAEPAVIVPQLNYELAKTVPYLELGLDRFRLNEGYYYHEAAARPTIKDLVLVERYKVMLTTQKGLEEFRSMIVALEDSNDRMNELKNIGGNVYYEEYRRLSNLNPSIHLALEELVKLTINTIVSNPQFTEQEWYGRYYQPRIIVEKTKVEKIEPIRPEPELPPAYPAVPSHEPVLSVIEEPTPPYLEKVAVPV